MADRQDPFSKLPDELVLRILRSQHQRMVDGIFDCFDIPDDVSIAADVRLSAVCKRFRRILSASSSLIWIVRSADDEWSLTEHILGARGANLRAVNDISLFVGHDVDLKAVCQLLIPHCWDMLQRFQIFVSEVAYSYDEGAASSDVEPEPWRLLWAMLHQCPLLEVVSIRAVYREASSLYPPLNMDAQVFGPSLFSIRNLTLKGCTTSGVGLAACLEGMPMIRELSLDGLGSGAPGDYVVSSDTLESLVWREQGVGDVEYTGTRIVTVKCNNLRRLSLECFLWSGWDIDQTQEVQFDIRCPGLECMTLRESDLGEVDGLVQVQAAPMPRLNTLKCDRSAWERVSRLLSVGPNVSSLTLRQVQHLPAVGKVTALGRQLKRLNLQNCELEKSDGDFEARTMMDLVSLEFTRMTAEIKARIFELARVTKHLSISSGLSLYEPDRREIREFVERNAVRVSFFEGPQKPHW